MKVIGYVFMIASVAASLGGAWVFISTNKKSNPKDFVGVTMVALFIFVTTATVGLIVLSTCDPPVMKIDSWLVKGLMAATVAEVAGICTLIVKAYFPAGK